MTGLCASRKARPEKLEWKRRAEGVARRNDADRAAQNGQGGVKGQQAACCRGEERRSRACALAAGRLAGVGDATPVNERDSTRSSSCRTDGGESAADGALLLRRDWPARRWNVARQMKCCQRRVSRKARAATEGTPAQTALAPSPFPKSSSCDWAPGNLQPSFSSDKTRRRACHFRTGEHMH